MPVDLAKSRAIQQYFAPLIGSRISRYETAELLLQEGRWISWPDLPIRILTDENSLVSVSWSRFDDLWLSNDNALPFVAEDATTRWLDNSITEINDCIGRTIRGVMLGRGQMTIGTDEIEIWTRIVIDLGDRWLEIFNALDENGYSLHRSKPAGEFVDCF